MEEVFIVDIISIVLSSLSILVAVYAAIVANKPYLKRIVLSESFCPESDCFAFSICNIGREVYFPKHITIIDTRTSQEVGFYSFSEKGNRLYAIAPGQIRSIKVSLYGEINYKHEPDVNPYLRVVLYDMYGKRKVFKNIFAVG